MQRRWLGVFAASFLISAAQPQTFRLLVSKSEVNAVEGDTVTLSVRPSYPVVSGFWRFHSSSIISWTVEPPYLNVAYTKRNVQLLFNTSLLLWSVELADSGVYQITADSRTGQEATANITLNVFPKPVPFSIVTESTEINATEGNTIQLKVIPSKKVKKGSWQMRGKVVAQWNDTVSMVSAEYQKRAALFNKCSLRLKSANISDTGEYKVFMSTESGDTSTASIQLNVLQEAQPLKVSAELSQINAEVTAEVLLSVRVSGKVKSGRWSIDNHTLFNWSDTIPDKTFNTLESLALLPNASLLIPVLFYHMDGVYIISLTSPTGLKATANIAVHIFASRKLCEFYNSVLAFLILLMLMFILFFTGYIKINHPKNHLQNFDFLFIFFKGYRTCLSLVVMVSFIFIIIIAISVNKESCVLGQQPGGEGEDPAIASQNN